MRGAVLGLRNDAPDLLQLFHQMRLRRQATRGVRNHDVAAARLCRHHRIKGHAGRIAALLADDVHAATGG